MSRTAEEIEAGWRHELTVGHRPQRLGRALFRALPSDPRCKLCHNPFGGVGGKLVGMFGFRPSRKTPNMCQKCCERMPLGGAEIDLAILFADVRGSTGIAEGMASGEYAALLNRFYSVATSTLIGYDAVVDKLIGDEVMALFVPGFCGQDYRRRAGEAALGLLSAIGYGTDDEPLLPVGVGVHAGVAYVGNVGTEETADFTALGDAVNTASRLQALAQPGQIAATGGVYEELSGRFPEAEERVATLKGKEEPVAVRVISVG